jgi:hypothetical protein
MKIVAEVSWGPTRHSVDILHKAKEDHLDRIHSGQNVLKMIRHGRLVLMIGGKESKKLAHGTIMLESTEIRWF